MSGRQNRTAPQRPEVSALPEREQKQEDELLLVSFFVPDQLCARVGRTWMNFVAGRIRRILSRHQEGPNREGDDLPHPRIAAERRISPHQHQQPTTRRPRPCSPPGDCCRVVGVGGAAGLAIRPRKKRTRP